MTEEEFLRAAKHSLNAAEYLTGLAHRENVKGVRKMLHLWAGSVAMVVKELTVTRDHQKRKLLAAPFEN